MVQEPAQLLDRQKHHRRRLQQTARAERIGVVPGGPAMRHARCLILSLAALALPTLAPAGQPPTPGFSNAPSTASYVATGSTAEADLARLRAVLLKVAGVEQVDLSPRAGGATLHIRGPQTGT